MSVKVCIDAGHYGKYNRSPVYPQYYESDMSWKLHLKLKKALEAYGIGVVTTRSNQATDLRLRSRGMKASGCNLFVSLHSNAVSNAGQSSTDRVEVIYPVSGKASNLAKSLAEAISKTMGTSKPYKVYSRKGNSGDYYGVIKGATAVGVPGLILEHSFHDYKNGDACPSKWLMEDANLEKLAKAEAEVIANYYGLTKNGATNTASSEKTPASSASSSSTSFKVKVDINDLNIRSGPGVNYSIKGQTGKGVFTIVSVIGNWGKLKSGQGWISLKYAKRI